MQGTAKGILHFLWMELRRNGSIGSCLCTAFLCFRQVFFKAYQLHIRNSVKDTCYNANFFISQFLI